MSAIDDLALGQAADRGDVARQRDRTRLAVLMDDQRRRGRPGRAATFSSPSTSDGLAAELALLQPGVGLERRPRAARRGPSRAPRRSRGRPALSSVTSAGSACSKCSASAGESGKTKRFGAQTSETPTRLAGIHLLEDALGELDRLQAAAEGLGEEALDQATQASFEFAEDRHAATFAQVGMPCASRGRFYPSVCCGSVATSELVPKKP